MDAKHIKLSSQVLMQKVADEAVLLDLDSQCYFGLDEIGTLIWEGLGKSKTEDEIVGEIVEEFDVSEEVAARDVREFLRKLEQDKLITLE